MAGTTGEISLVLRTGGRMLRSFDRIAVACVVRIAVFIWRLIVGWRADQLGNGTMRKYE